MEAAASAVPCLHQLTLKMQALRDSALSSSAGLVASLPASVSIPVQPVHDEVRHQPAIVTGWDWLLHRLSRETSGGRFIPEVDGLRFVAIGMVILFHLNGYLQAASSLPYSGSWPNSDWLAQIALLGFRGVELFFVISGFILGLPFAAHHLKDAAQVDVRKYYLRRLTRLEPPYFVTVLLLFVLALWVQGKTAAVLYPHLAASLFYLHNLIYGYPSPAIGVAWSLEIEVQFYVLVPLLTLLFAIRRRWLRRVTLVALILGILSAQILFLPPSGPASLSILAYLQFFLIGFLLADVFLVDWKESPQSNPYWDLVAVAGWPLLFIVLRSDTLAHWLFPFLLFLLYCAAFRGSWSRRILSHPGITVIGGMCYSIYLIHYEVISATGRFTKGIAESLPFLAYFLAQVALIGASILLVCGLYFVLLEKPCMRRNWPRRVWSYLEGLIYARSRVTESAAAD
jgi:peptidoglycan/LPS O-acetylase OafA/YrhL